MIATLSHTEPEQSDRYSYYTYLASSLLDDTRSVLVPALGREIVIKVASTASE